MEVKDFLENIQAFWSLSGIEGSLHIDIKTERYRCKWNNYGIEMRSTDTQIRQNKIFIDTCFFDGPMDLYIRNTVDMVVPEELKDNIHIILDSVGDIALYDKILGVNPYRKLIDNVIVPNFYTPSIYSYNNYEDAFRSLIDLIEYVKHIRSI